MRHVIDTIGGVYELARLFVLSKGRLRGAYWTWRSTTAMGDGVGISPGARRAGIFEYARWVRRMRRLM
ncbi:MAG: hypothetical protein HUU18_05880 [Phycisphaerales bacterium]|nr:hypothetical protein [Phycisphaerales bacterium]